MPSLSSGTRLGPYEIIAPLGAGGMGEVYRATDTTLGRPVAIKILPEVFNADPDRLARFEREAKTLASLNHPQIAAIYGFERHGGSHALIMELVEGEDLSTVIARGALPLAEALPVARQVADALEAAHEAGIIHRDLKPANIKLRADGTAKVLDFGLAKAADPPDAASASAMNSPTLTARATQMGMILGTAAYMAPEQAKGRTVDKRADIWAFGVVLFEMLTGQRAFKGDDISETLASVIKDAPALDALPLGTPVRLRELLARCLQKDPRQRQRDIGDVKLELDAIAKAPDVGSGDPVTSSRARPSPLLVGAVALAMTAIGLAIGWALPRGSGATATAATPTRFIVGSPERGDGESPVLTPDGRVLIFRANQLYKRELGAFSAMPIPGTDGARVPIVSPDGRWVAFFRNGLLKKASLDGGDPVTIAEVNSAIPGADWGPGNTILFSRGWSTGLSSIEVDGGGITALTEPDRARGERGHWRPHVLPGGQQVLFTIWMAGSGLNEARVGLLDLKTRTHRALFPGADAVYLASGHLLYFHAGAWHVVPFDAAAGTVTGESAIVLDDAFGEAPDGGGSDPLLSVASNGTVAYTPGPSVPKQELVWMDRTGKIESLGLAVSRINDAALSPDSRLVATSRLEGGTYEIWMHDIGRKTADRLDIKGSNFSVRWGPRGETIGFISERKGDYDAYTARPDGSNVQPLLTTDVDEMIVAWTQDGRRLVEKEWRADGSSPVSVINLPPAPDRPGRVLIPNASNNFSSTLSPNDRWLLHTNSAGGQREIFLQRVEGQAAPVRVSHDGGDEPQWSRDGKEIIFRRRNTLVSVSFHEEGDRAVVGDEHVVCTLPEFAALRGIGADGRFLMSRSAEPQPAPGIRVVVDWFSEVAAATRRR